jgi:hypothetical protein
LKAEIIPDLQETYLVVQQAVVLEEEEAEVEMDPE